MTRLQPKTAGILVVVAGLFAFTTCAIPEYGVDESNVPEGTGGAKTTGPSAGAGTAASLASSSLGGATAVAVSSSPTGNALGGANNALGGANNALGGASVTGSSPAGGAPTGTGGVSVAGATHVLGTGGACGVRNCASATDNNCDGTPDSQETACYCTNGSSLVAPNGERNCSSGGLGECALGYQRCALSADRSSVQWGMCSAVNVATNEACGPQAPDANCSGIKGDGQGCKSVVTLWERDVPSDCHSYVVSCSGATATYCSSTTRHVAAVAGSGTPGSGWTKTTKTFNVFPTAVAGTVELRNCTIDGAQIAALGKCEGPIVGYVSTVANNAGYVRLSLGSLRSMSNSTEYYVLP